MRWLVLVLLMFAGAARADDACGRAEWCLELAALYQTGADPLPQDAERADRLRHAGLRLLGAACQSGDPVACTRAGAVAQNIDPAALPAIHAAGKALCKDWFAGACNPSATSLGDRDGMRLLRDAARQKAVQDWQTPCLGGADAACAALWQRIRGAWRGQDIPPPLAARLMDRCLGPAPDICRELAARLYLLPDRHLATSLAARLDGACDTGHAMACLVLAHAMTLRPPDDHAAAACDLGLGEGCGLLGGQFYARFADSQGDLAPAADAWARGCELGHVPSCHYLKHLSRQ